MYQRSSIMTRDEFTEVVTDRVYKNLNMMDDDSLEQAVQCVALGFNEGIEFVLDLLSKVEGLEWTK